MSLNENEKVEFLALDKPLEGKANGEHGRSYFDVQQASWTDDIMTSKSITSLGDDHSPSREAPSRPRMQDVEENKQNQATPRLKLYHSQQWLNILQQTEHLMPLENKYYRNLADQFSELKIHHAPKYPEESRAIEFDAELFAKQREAKSNSINP